MHARLRYPDPTHNALIQACTPAARLIGSAEWFSARVAASLERQERDPWTLTLTELAALIETTSREPGEHR